MDNKKQIGYKNEELVKQHYLQNWYELIKWNYTIQWWEIDLLMRKWGELVVIEVKTVNNIDELDNYITEKKIWFLQRTLEKFLQNIDESRIENIRMDAVFIKNNQILEIYEDITNK